MRRNFTPVAIVLLILTLAGTGGLASPLFAQPADISEAVKAVVRIHGCNSGAGCMASPAGSGVIIHPSGVILTAWHITVGDPANLASPPYEDFLIEMTEDDTQPPRPRYRAQLIASKPAEDLALLRIYQTYDGGNSGEARELGALYDLTALAISEQRPHAEQLRIVGYSPEQGDTITYPTYAHSGFEDNGARLKVIGPPLTKGYSGGPALVERNGRFEIVGVVILKRGENTGIIRNVSQLNGMAWPQEKPLAWGDHVQVVAGNVNGVSKLRISLDLHIVDLADRQLLLDTFVFDAGKKPWRPPTTTLPKNGNGQLVLQQDIRPTKFVETKRVTLEVPQSELGASPDRLLFQLMLRDGVDKRGLWQPPQMVQAELVGDQVTLVPTGASTPTDTLSPTPMPTSTSNPTSTSTFTPEATPTPLPAPTDTPIVAATSTPPPTATNTPVLLPTDTPMTVNRSIIQGAPKVNFRAGPGTGFAIVQTLNNQDEVILLGRNSDSTWLFVKAQSGATGWVAANFVRTSTVLELLPITESPPTPSAPAPGGLPEFNVNGVRFSFVQVPAGEFRMGSNDAEIQRAIDLCLSYPNDGGGDCKDKFGDEQPTRTLALGAFWIMKTEVTNAQFDLFIRAGGYENRDYWSDEGWNWRANEGISEPGYWKDPRLNGANYPVVGLSWYEAEAYARWLSQQTKLSIRLPTEPEWEKAARGTKGWLFPWGNQWEGTRANFCDRNCTEFAWADQAVSDGYAQTAPVGSYPAGASPYGALDMAGNVWEYVAERARRGGSWQNDPEVLRTAERLFDERYVRSKTLEYPSKSGTGFRLAVSE